MGVSLPSWQLGLLLRGFLGRRVVPRAHAAKNQRSNETRSPATTIPSRRGVKSSTRLMAARIFPSPTQALPYATERRRTPTSQRGSARIIAYRPSGLNSASSPKPQHFPKWYLNSKVARPWQRSVRKRRSRIRPVCQPKFPRSTFGFMRGSRWPNNGRWRSKNDRGRWRSKNDRGRWRSNSDRRRSNSDRRRSNSDRRRGRVSGRLVDWTLRMPGSRSAW